MLYHPVTLGMYIHTTFHLLYFRCSFYLRKEPNVAADIAAGHLPKAENNINQSEYIGTDAISLRHPTTT